MTLWSAFSIQNPTYLIQHSVRFLLRVSQWLITALKVHFQNEDVFDALCAKVCFQGFTMVEVFAHGRMRQDQYLQDSSSWSVANNANITLSVTTIIASCPFCSTQMVNTLRPRQNGRHSADDIFPNVFSSMKMFEFRLKFHWSLFLKVQLTKC